MVNISTIYLTVVMVFLGLFFADDVQVSDKLQVTSINLKSLLRVSTENKSVLLGNAASKIW